MGKKKKEIKAKDKKPVISNEPKENMDDIIQRMKSDYERSLDYLWRGLPSGENELKE